MRLMLMLICTCGPTLFAQDSVSKERDAEIAAIMARVEARDEQQELTIVYEVKAENEDQQKMIDALDTYLGILGEDDVMAAYNMLCNVYRKEVSFSDYAKKDRLTYHEVTVQRAEFDGDCALFRGSAKADTGTAMGVMRVPIKVHIFQEDGQWHVYKNPYEVAGFMNPKGRSIKPPCSFYDKTPADE